MAERRMFSRSIIETDKFIELPSRAQAMYLQLLSRADDDGFVAGLKLVQMILKASKKDLDALIDGGYLITFPSGVGLVTHFKVFNKIRSDRYKPTVYQEEFKQVTLDSSEKYVRLVSEMSAECPHSDSKMSAEGQTNCGEMSAQDSIGKDRVGKDSLDKEREERAEKPLSAPSLEDIYLFRMEERLFATNPEIFFNHYTARSWCYPSGQRVLDWRAEFRKWNARDKEEKDKKTASRANFSGRDTVYDDSLYDDISKLEV